MSKAYRTYGIKDMTKTNVDMAGSREVGFPILCRILEENWRQLYTA